jgi:hypothetical protein
MKPTDYMEIWTEHFIKLNNRKPTKQEQMCFRVGFNAGENYMKDELSSKQEEAK